jgi:hypothetical protein
MPVCCFTLHQLQHGTDEAWLKFKVLLPVAAASAQCVCLLLFTLTDLTQHLLCVLADLLLP